MSLNRTHALTNCLLYLWPSIIQQYYNQIYKKKKKEKKILEGWWGRWWWWSWLKFVVFINGHRYIPSATEPPGQDHKISSPKLHTTPLIFIRWIPFWISLHLPFQQITRLFCIKFQLILPRRTTPSSISTRITSENTIKLTRNKRKDTVR